MWVSVEVSKVTHAQTDRPDVHVFILGEINRYFFKRNLILQIRPCRMS